MPIRRFSMPLLLAAASVAAVPPGFAASESGLPAVVPSNSVESDTASPVRILRGDDRVIAAPKLPSSLEGPATAFKFEDAPLVDVVQIVLRDILKVDYVIHQQINGSVTMATRSEVTPDQAIALLESALQANGIVMARDVRGVYHLGRPDALKGIVAAPRQAGNGPLPPGTGVIVVPLQYIGAAEMAAILRPLLPPDALLRVDGLRNLLVLAGSRTQADGWLDLVSTFDVDLLKGMSVGVFPLKYASVREVETALRLLTAGAAPSTTPSSPGGTANAGAASGGASASGAGATGNASAEFSVLFGGMRIMPIERINSVLIVTPRAANLDAVRSWIERFDQPNNSSTESQLFVYPVQNGSASHLASVLNGIFGGQAGSSASTGTGVSPSLASSSSSTSTSGLGMQGASASLGSIGSTTQSSAFGAQRQTAQSGAQGGVTAVTLPQGVRIISDGINNAVLVYGTRSEFNKIEATLKRLDVPPTQVLIEASIIEVSLNDDLQYGLQWTFADKARGGLNGNGVLSTAASGVLGAAAAGFSYTLTNSLGGVRAVLSALADKSLVKVISSPSLMVLDNHTASIAVGNQQPIQSGTTITTGGVVSSSIQYKDTGVNLSVTPSVTSGNLVTMQINQAVTDVGQIDTATGQRAFLQRQIASKVAVRSGETLVLGGLIRDNTTTGKSGLPGLQDIPFFGNLFGASTKSAARTELLVVITPRVVRTDTDLRELGSEMRERMKSFSGISALRENPILLPPGPVITPGVFEPQLSPAPPRSISN